MVLDDKAADKIDQQSIDKVFAPKIKGTQNLFKRYPDAKKILFSSVSSIIGIKGQAAYAGANSFMDVFGSNNNGYVLNLTAIGDVGALLIQKSGKI